MISQSSFISRRPCQEFHKSLLRPRITTTTNGMFDVQEDCCCRKDNDRGDETNIDWEMEPLQSFDAVIEESCNNDGGGKYNDNCDVAVSPQDNDSDVISCFGDEEFINSIFRKTDSDTIIEDDPCSHNDEEKLVVSSVPQQTTEMETTGKQPTVVSPRESCRPGKYKRHNGPKRFLSAYNLFFQRERRRILDEFEQKQRNQDGQLQDATLPDVTPEPSVVVASSKKQRRKKVKTGSIGFQALGKMIGERWQQLPMRDRKHLYELSALDRERFRREMSIFEKQRLQKIQRCCRPHSLQSNSPTPSVTQCEERNDQRDALEVVSVSLDTSDDNATTVLQKQYTTKSIRLPEQQLRESKSFSGSPSLILENPSFTVSMNGKDQEDKISLNAIPNINQKENTKSNSTQFYYPSIPVPNPDGIMMQERNTGTSTQNFGLNTSAHHSFVNATCPYANNYSVLHDDYKPVTPYGRNNTSNKYVYMEPSNLPRSNEDFNCDNSQMNSIKRIRYAPISLLSDVEKVLPASAVPVELISSPMYVLIPDMNGQDHTYKVEYKSYKMSKIAADQFIANLQDMNEKD